MPRGEPQYVIDIQGPDGSLFTCRVWLVAVGNKLVTLLEISPPPTPEQRAAMNPAIENALVLILHAEGFHHVHIAGHANTEAEMRRHLGGGVG